MKRFLELAKNPKISKKVLLVHIDPAAVNEIIEEWTREFEVLLPQIPYITVIKIN